MEFYINFTEIKRHRELYSLMAFVFNLRKGCKECGVKLDIEVCHNRINSVSYNEDSASCSCGG